jgi:hypothetical protein
MIKQTNGQQSVIAIQLVMLSSYRRFQQSLWSNYISNDKIEITTLSILSLKRSNFFNSPEPVIDLITITVFWYFGPFDIWTKKKKKSSQHYFNS